MHEMVIADEEDQVALWQKRLEVTLKYMEHEFDDEGQRRNQTLVLAQRSVTNAGNSGCQMVETARMTTFELNAMAFMYQQNQPVALLQPFTISHLLVSR